MMTKLSAAAAAPVATAIDEAERTWFVRELTMQTFYQYLEKHRFLLPATTNRSFTSGSTLDCGASAWGYMMECSASPELPTAARTSPLHLPAPWP